MKVIAIAAVTAGGKTTVVNEIKNKLPKTAALHLCCGILKMLVYPAAERNHPEKPRLFIPQAVKCGTVCAVLLILHELVIFYFFKVFIFDMVNISFLVNHSLPTVQIKIALPFDRA